MTQPMDNLMQTARDAGFWKDLFAYPEFKDSLTTFAQVVAEKAVEAEREACAKMCENGVDTEHPAVKGHIMKDFGASGLLAAAIRARGQT